MTILIITHWDTDGISSAALLKRMYPDSQVYVPRIGEFSLSETELEKLELNKYEAVFICDYALPRENLIYLKKKIGMKTVILDHHLWKAIEGIQIINPIIRGESLSMYPSTTWVIKTHYSLELSIPIILGVVGDHGYKATGLRVWRMIEIYNRRVGIDIEQLNEAVELIDSNYQVMDIDGVYSAIDLLSNIKDIGQIRDNDRWIRNRELFNQELEELEKRALDELRDEKYVFFDFSSKYYVISPLARRFAWKRGIPILLVNRGFFEDRDQVFIRLPYNYNVDLKDLLINLQEEGYVAGGRSDVLGVITSKNDTDVIVKRILKYMNWSIS
jgi:hypothetical protein